MHDDDIAIDYLLSELGKHGPSQFDVSKELEVRFGTDFANKLSVFYERSLEYYNLAKRSPENGLIELTRKGHEVIQSGGWLVFKRLDEIANEEEFRREIERRDREVKREASHDKYKLQRTQNMSAIALVLAIAALVLSIANFLSSR